MKRKIVALALLLLVMALIPCAVVGLTGAVKTSREPEKADRSAGVIGLAASLCEEDFCEEAMRAMMILANTNYREETESKNDSNKEIYDRLKSIYLSNKELYIQKDGAAAPLPYAVISNGSTKTDEKYPTLAAVASPWDCLDSKADKNARCVGVSLRGVNYLCQRGYSAEEALLHYLPDYEIVT